jgi:hypothetical protein
MLKQASWDLMALVWIGGMISTVYQYRNHVFTRAAYLRAHLLMAGVGVIVAVGVGVLLVIMKWAAR